MNRIIYFFVIISLCLLVLSGCTDKNTYTLEDKITEEVKYMENKMIDIVNNFALGYYYIQNNTSNVDNSIQINNIEDMPNDNLDALDYEKILLDTRRIEEASNRILVDLAAENVDNEEMGRLSTGINNMITALDSKDERMYLAELNNVFSLFPNYEASISDDSDEIFERRLKYFTISSYLAFIVGDKELAKTQVQTLENEYLEKQKNVEYVEKHKYNLNKIYLIIEELKGAIESDSEILVKEKYLLLINEI